MKLEAILTMEGPLAISRRRATGNDLESLMHIPGASWRGALAADVIREGKLGDGAHRDAGFHALFLAGKARFGDLRHEGGTPWPLSARVCSRHEEHGIQDLLVRSALGEKLPLECGFPVAGAACGSKLATPNGFAVWDGNRARGERPPMRVAAHTAIDGELLLPKAGQFFSSEVVEAGTRFLGEVWLKDLELATELRGPRLLTVGRGATRGQGLATLVTREPAKERTTLRERLARLNGRFAKDGMTAFTCTLRSPCLVVDDFLSARPYLTVEDIEEATDARGALAGYRLRAWFSRMATIGGWNARAGLPRADAHVMAPGSAFLFTHEAAESEREAELDRLAKVLAGCERGIGERWEEGFGEAEFCDRLHYELERR